MQRRAFIKWGSIGAITASITVLPYGLARLLTPVVGAAPAHQRLRPPGALRDDDAFVAACIGCGLCGEVCPPRCIRFYKHDGGDKANTPYINPEKSACTLCGLCMPTCPTSALQSTARDDIDMGIAQIDRTACYPWVDKGVCGACVSVCPLGQKAIGFAFANVYKPVVKQACVGCGRCVEVCPHPSLPIRIGKRGTGTVIKHRVQS